MSTFWTPSGGRNPALNHTALQTRASEPGGTALRTAFTTAAALSPADRARWHLLALQRPASGPLVDAAWIVSWATAFNPISPVLACAWEGENLAGLAALQSLTEIWWGRQ